MGNDLRTAEPVNVKEVVRIAADYLKDLVGDAQEVRLEEVDERAGINQWSVVLSYSLPYSREANLVTTLNGIMTRNFKEVIVKPEERKAVALKFWKP